MLAELAHIIMEGKKPGLPWTDRAYAVKIYLEISFAK
jgi:hypothetical protein